LYKHITHPHRHAGKVRKANLAKNKVLKAQAAVHAHRVEAMDALAAKKAAKKQKRKREAKKKKKRKSKKKRKKQTEEGGASCDDSSTTDSSSSSSDDGDEEQPAPAKKAKHATERGPQSPAPATPKGPPPGTPATPSAPPGKQKTVADGRKKVSGAAARKKAPPAAAAALLDIPNFAPNTGLCMTNAAVGFQRMAACMLVDDEPPGLERGWKLVTGIQRTINGAKFTIPKDQILRTCHAKSRLGDKTDYTTIENDDDR
jgi:hypothetical protein